jgi:phospholipase C
VPLTDKDRNAEETQQVQTKFNKSDLGAPAGCFPNDAYIGKNAITQNEAYDSSPPPGAPPGSESRFDCFKQKFQAQVSAGTVPAFNYLVLSNDHTEGTTPGRRTPRAMVAENDYGLGQVVDLISHSPVWSSSAIFVIEDDSQDGSDHVDAHRMPAAVISPYARPGAVIHTRYDMLSVIRSMELILGMKPLGLFDRLATPMYDAFSSKPANSAPFAVLPPTYPLNERNAATAANAKLSKSLRINKPDRVPQRLLDRILWQSVHGARSEPPPPGPNAEPGE